MPRPLQIQIPTPCHENWQTMTPNEKGRHCMSCQKTVIDFTNMSDRQILAHITNASNSVCGRFYGDQLNKDLVVPEIRKRFSWAYLWNLAFASFLVTGKANAQVRPPYLKSDTALQVHSPHLFVGMVAYRKEEIMPVKGLVIDTFSWKVIGGATIINKKTKQTYFSDSLRPFSIIPQGKEKVLSLTISANGYKSISKKYNIGKDQPLIIYLEPINHKPAEENQTQTFGCKNDNSSDDVIVVGKVAPRYSVSTTGKIIRSLSDTLLSPFKKDVKVYPNPVTRGSAINLSLSFKETGEYKAELMDADGRVVLIQSLIVNSNEQSAQLETNPSWSPGIYWLRFSGRNKKSVYQGRVIIE